MIQHRPPWGCSHGTYALNVCGKCEKEYGEFVIQQKIIDILTRVEAKLDASQ